MRACVFRERVWDYLLALPKDSKYNSDSKAQSAVVTQCLQLNASHSYSWSPVFSQTFPTHRPQKLQGVVLPFTDLQTYLRDHSKVFLNLNLSMCGSHSIPVSVEFHHREMHSFSSSPQYSPFFPFFWL